MFLAMNSLNPVDPDLEKIFSSSSTSDSLAKTGKDAAFNAYLYDSKVAGTLKKKYYSNSKP